MNFEKKVPNWENLGAEPSEELKKEGFKAGYKPPAAYFNWFFNRIQAAVKELQETLKLEIKGLAFKDTVGNDEITDMSGEKILQDAGHRLVSDEEKVSWHGKIDAMNGDISETKVAVFEESAAQFPIPDAGESPKSLWGKMRKFGQDFNNWRTGVCMIGSIVNNCATDRADLPLSAAQGKGLMDLYNVLNTNFAKLNNDYIKHIEIQDIHYTDLNDTSQFPVGFYFCNIYRTAANLPAEDLWGSIFINKTRYTMLQFIVPVNMNYIYYRHGWIDGGGYVTQEWRTI